MCRRWGFIVVVAGQIVTEIAYYSNSWTATLLKTCFHKRAICVPLFLTEQEPVRLRSCQAGFNGTDRLKLDAKRYDQAVTGNQGYFEG